MEDARSPRSLFPTTMWSRVVRASRHEDRDSQSALSELCQAYWYPLYAFARRRTLSPPDAEDAVQGFFAHLLSENICRYADQTRGRFRNFLMAAFQQFQAHQYEYKSALKRAEPKDRIPLDVAEARYAGEVSHGVTPERLFEYTWAVAVLARAMDRLRDEHARDGRLDRFEACRGTLTGQSKQPMAELAKLFNTSEGAVRVAIHRMRQRYGEILREEVAGTLDDDQDVQAELGDLFAALNLDPRV